MYSAQALDELVEAGRGEEEKQVAQYRALQRQSTLLRVSEEKRSARREARAQEALKVARNRAYWEKMAQEQEQQDRKLRARIEALREQMEAKFQKMFEGVLDGKRYTQQIDDMLDFHDAMEKRKQTQLHSDWEEQVFGKIQSRIQKKLTKKELQRLGKVRRQEYDKFLDTTNKKESLFLDIIIESDYDPFVVNRAGVRYKAGKLDDPTKRVLARYSEEQNMIPSMQGPADAGKAQGKPSRGALDVHMWATGKVESTPHGYFAKLMADPKERRSNAGDADGEGSSADPYASNIDMDHFAYPRGKDAIDAEFPRGKRTDYPALERDQPLIS